MGNTIFRDRFGNILTNRAKPDGYQTLYAGSLDIPLIKAIVEREDTRFWQHA